MEKTSNNIKSWKRSYVWWSVALYAFIVVLFVVSQQWGADTVVITTGGI